MDIKKFDTEFITENYNFNIAIQTLLFNRKIHLLSKLSEIDTELASLPEEKEG